MAFGTTNYPVFVEFQLAEDRNAKKVAVAISSIQTLSPDSKAPNSLTVISINGAAFSVIGNYDYVMDKIKAKIPKPAKWPPAIESKKDDSLPPQNTYPRSGDSHRLF